MYVCIFLKYPYFEKKLYFFSSYYSWKVSRFYSFLALYPASIYCDRVLVSFEVLKKEFTYQEITWYCLRSPKNVHCSIWIWVLSCLDSWWHFPSAWGRACLTTAQVPTMCTMNLNVLRLVVIVQSFPNARAGIQGMPHRQIVPMSMWLINPPERIRGTFPEELCNGLTSFLPQVTACGTHAISESAHSGLSNEHVPSYHHAKYTEEQHFGLRSLWHLPDSFCPAVAATGVVVSKQKGVRERRREMLRHLVSECSEV